MKWVTRERPKIDRIACPWLIARFIDREPEFLFVPPGDVLASARDRTPSRMTCPTLNSRDHGLVSVGARSLVNLRRRFTLTARRGPSRCSQIRSRGFKPDRSNEEGMLPASLRSHHQPLVDTSGTQCTR
jgi:hypothetical protein